VVHSATTLETKYVPTEFVGMSLAAKETSRQVLKKVQTENTVLLGHLGHRENGAGVDYGTRRKKQAVD
jgi:hypothetical protein